MYYMFILSSKLVSYDEITGNVHNLGIKLVGILMGLQCVW